MLERGKSTKWKARAFLKMLFYDGRMKEESKNDIGKSHAYLTIGSSCNAYTKRGPDWMLHT